MVIVPEELRAVVACPFCGVQATIVAWGQRVDGEERTLEGFECICGAWFYSAMPDDNGKNRSVIAARRAGAL